MSFRILLTLSTIFSSCTLWIPPQQDQNFLQIEVHFLNIGQGNATLLRIGKEWMLVDAGPDSSGILDSLEIRGIDTLKWVYITHNHRDHIGGLWEIAGRIPIRQIFFGPDQGNLWALDSVRRLLLHTSTLFEARIRGDSVPVSPPWKARILWPPEGEWEGNSASAALWIGDADASILWMGDLGTQEEQELLQKEPDLNASILQVGHHGSATSTSLEFLGRVFPQAAVICVGENPWGHPREETLDRLHFILRDSTRILRTDRQGTLEMRLLPGFGLLMSE